MSDYAEDELAPVIYHDGTVWFHLFDPHENAVIATRGVCFVHDDVLPERNTPVPLPWTVSSAPTDVPTDKRTGRPLRALRWATPHDVDPA